MPSLRYKYLLSAALLLIFPIGTGLFLVSWNPQDEFPFITLQHDFNWFYKVVVIGYNVDKTDSFQTNPAFAPGYPIIAYLLGRITSLTPQWALVITSWLSSLVFWIYFWRILISQQVPTTVLFVVTCSMALFPGSVFLSVGYAEPLYMATMLAFFYYSLKPVTLRNGILTTIFGTLMTASRISLVTIVVAPLLYKITSRVKGLASSTFAYNLTLSTLPLIGATSGAVAFFIYCSIKFGHWDQYLISQKEGWGCAFDPSFIVSPTLWRIDLPSMHPEAAFLFEVDELSFFLAQCYWYLVLFLPCIDFYLTKKSSLHIKSPRNVFYLTALILNVLYLGTKVNVAFTSMLRLLIAIHCCLLLATAMLLVELIQDKRWKTVHTYLWTIALITALSAGIYLICLKRYLLFLWVS